MLLSFSPMKVTAASAASRQVSSEGAPMERGHPCLWEFHSSRISARSLAPKQRASPQEGPWCSQAHPVLLEISHPTLSRPIRLFPWQWRHFNHLQMYKASLPVSFRHLAIAFCMARLEMPTLYLYTCMLHLYLA